MQEFQDKFHKLTRYLRFLST